MTKYVLEVWGYVAERAIYRSINATVAQFKSCVLEKWVNENVFTNMLISVFWKCFQS